jgi:uncharacterized protein (DUF58 family)
MLTERGWAASGGGLAFLILWVVLGEIELAAAAALLAVGLLLGLGLTRWSRARVEVARHLRPALVHEGDRALVEITIANDERRRVHQLTVTDSVGGMGTAEFSLARLRPGERAVATYQIICRPRGVYAVGPALARVSDPLGFAAVARTVGPTDRLIVYPRIEELSGFPRVRGRDPAMQASRPEHSRRGGEDFYTLRDYQIGDDLRRVHWPSSAKRDELMIRQMETPWQARALVLLDVRGEVYEQPAAFELAVRGAASVISHLAGSGFDADLWVGGQGTIDSHHYAAAMEALAGVNTLSGIDMRGVAIRLRRTGRGGALFLVTGLPDPDLLGLHQLLSRDYRTSVLLSAAETTSTTTAAFVHAGSIVIRVPPDASWGPAWIHAMGKTWAPASAG